MIEIIVIFVFIIGFFSCLFHMAGWAIGDTYDYQYRRKTYHGTKTLLWFAVLVVMYHLPWQRWGMFTT